MHYLPTVSVICLCYNHAPFLREALDSVFTQDYPNIDVILVDDASEDGSQEILQEYHQKYPISQLILHTENKGNCKSFNEAYQRSLGEYIIDFATDDCMLPERLKKQVQLFEELPQDAGVVYANTEYIDENSTVIKEHFSATDIKPEGRIFKDILARHIVEPSSMMVKKKVFDTLRGYDETLAYEDFDFMVRATYGYKFHYLDEVISQRRKSQFSHSKKLEHTRYKAMFVSTLKVCEKALQLCSSTEEKQALSIRLRYQMRHAFKWRYYALVKEYFQLLYSINKVNLLDRLFYSLSVLLVRVKN